MIACKAHCAALLIFGFFILGYLVLSPGVFSPEIYSSWVSSILLYSVMDAWLLVRAWTRFSAVVDPSWKAALGWIAVSCGLWFVGDVYEGLMYLEMVPWIDAATPADTLWHLPALTLLLAVRSRSEPG